MNPITFNNAFGHKSLSWTIFSKILKPEGYMVPYYFVEEKKNTPTSQQSLIVLHDLAGKW